jgi:adenosylmethionine-8-amino-7-oxononanoate aminotransferase
VEDAGTNQPFPAGRKLGDELKRTALENGLILRIDPDWFAVCPPLIAEEADVDELCGRIRASLESALGRVRARGK